MTVARVAAEGLDPAIGVGLVDEWVLDGRRALSGAHADGGQLAHGVVDGLVGESTDVSGRGESSPTAPRIRTLAEIMADPAASREPEVVVPRMAWRGRTTLLAGREKLGKSTLASAAIACASGLGSPYLDGHAGPAEVLLVALEEHVGDVARRLAAHRATACSVHIIDQLEQPLDQLDAAVAHLGPALIVVDTLPALVERLELDPGRSTDWTPVMQRLVRLARATDAAIVLLHHGTKADGRYRDSTAIGAGVDVILEMSEDPSDARVRRIRARGRITVRDYAVRLAGRDDAPRIELADGELSLDARVMQAVEAEPGLSRRRVCELARGGRSDILETVARLIERGLMEDRGPEHHSALHPASRTKRALERPGTDLGPSVDRFKPQPPVERPRNGDGTPSGTDTDLGACRRASPYGGEAPARNAQSPSFRRNTDGGLAALDEVVAFDSGGGPATDRQVARIRQLAVMLEERQGRLPSTCHWIDGCLAMGLDEYAATDLIGRVGGVLANGAA